MKNELHGDSTSAAGIIVLAAGASTRLGAPKQLLDYQGKSLLRHAAETALASRCQPTVVVLGAHASELLGEISKLDIEVVENVAWAEGMGSSIRAGVSKVNEKAGEIAAVVIMLCDQPLVSAKVIDELVTAHHESGAWIVASEYSGAVGAPALFTREMFPELMELPATEGAKQVIMRHLHRVRVVAVPVGAFDIDTRKDYEELQSLTDLPS